MNTSTQVLIVGAGPTGLTLALELSHYNVPFRIIDQKSMPTQTSNAGGVQARTLELLAAHGVTDEMLARGRKMNHVEIFSHDKKLVTWQIDNLDSPFPFILALPQCDTEAILVEALKQRHVEIEWNTTLQTLSDNGNIVNATILRDGKTEAITANFAVGCDGYHSVVRDQMGIAFKGDDLTLHFIMMDGALTWNKPSDSFYLFVNKQYFLLVVPFLNSFRIIAEVSRDPAYDNFDHIDEKDFLKIFSKLTQEKVAIATPAWTSKFWIHERLAERYQKGRVFLAGDAAHTHSPAGAQGMNTGIQDSINLGWKLALVTSNKAAIALLDSYESERRPVAERVIKSSGRLTRLIMTHNPFKIFMRRFVLKILQSIHALHRKMIAEVSEIAVNYRKSPLVLGEKTVAHAPGDRAPDARFMLQKGAQLFDYFKREHVLLVFSGQPALIEQLTQTYQGRARVLPIAEMELEVRVKYGINHPGVHFCVVRPDNYIGYLGRDEAGLKQYFEQIFKV